MLLISVVLNRFFVRTVRKGLADECFGNSENVVISCLQRGQWMDYCATEITPLVKVLLPSSSPCLPHARKQVLCEFTEKLQCLDNHLADGEYLGAESVQPADFVLAAELHTALDNFLDLELFRRFSHLERWYRNVSESPSFKKFFSH